MRWHEVTVHTTEEAIEMISNFIHELGAGGVSIEESGTLNKQRDTSFGQLYEHPLNNIPEGRAVIKGYFSEGTDMEVILRELKLSVELLSGYDIDTGEPTYELKDVDDEDWADAWKQYFKPLRITDRLTIKPTWEDYIPGPDELILELDPGMAFGTGTHATTALCLKTLEGVIEGGEDVIDVGTGSGVLAIAAAKLGAGHVLALDLDPVAVYSATENVRLNGLDQQITVKLSDLLQVINESRSNSAEGPLGVKLPVQVVVANILAEIILMFVDDVYEVLESGGSYIVSGIIKAKQESVEEALTAAGFVMTERHEDQDWVVLIARKP
ncbi:MULTISPECIES: 50S ribosomal protein L11 methyltransferase [unclassified Paenibacillus]|uniref:50S ribosomal protein L11 methyltransferase n=1 Tax=unclassified Paenibacillus TaxID=185978 RepID=UPI001AE3C28B|nr:MULTISPECIES: 50S ribosomal protein L11 methyltransferase [unclassified Paenibacillus]MBP1156353.1 ribosomal protein L11 methyltransferase [Paenibacillus sp. PvP091]MBP1168261.1 ribosomal protein L11 methyltransferase [Paenibacillus sp. PvR098]MBP2439289.1 ribosomal protein L11 methyltransferase [Paenibacillus sp. PvP052]